MRASRVAVAGAAILALSLVHCAIALDGYTNGPSDAATPDGGDATTTPGTTDGGSDGTVMPGGPFCAAHTTAPFCADFDDGPRDKGWDDNDTRGPGSLDLDSTTSVSGPKSLHAVYERISASFQGATFQQLEKTFSGAPRFTRLDFDLLLAPTAFQDTDTGFTIAEMYFDKDETHGVIILLDRDHWQLLLKPAQDDHIATAPFPTGAWTHVRIEVDPKPSGGTARIFFGDPPVLAVEALNAGLRTVDANETQVWIGLGSGEVPRPPVDAHYDNVLVDFP